MEVKHVLCISSLDTSGFSGISADIAAVSMQGLHPLPVIVNYAIESQEKVLEVFPVGREVVEKAIKNALSEEIACIKLGMLGKNTELVAELLPESKPIIGDPVFLASSGQAFASQPEIEVFANKIARQSLLITPNIPEAEMLLGKKICSEEEAKKACLELHERLGCGVLLKGGHLNANDYLAWQKEIYFFAGKKEAKELRGTGCFLASLIASFIAKGYAVPIAVAQSKEVIQELIANASFAGKKYWLNPSGTLARNAERWLVYKSLFEALPEFLALLKNEHIPEVGINIGYALPEAKTKEEVCAIDGRIGRSTEGPWVRRLLRFGAGDHVPRIILTAMKFDRKKRCAMNLRYRQELIEKAKNLGFVVCEFSRKAQPEQQGTMEWGTEMAVRAAGKVPDLIYDTGDVGKEPMIRLIAENPRALLEKLRKLVA